MSSIVTLLITRRYYNKQVKTKQQQQQMQQQQLSISLYATVPEQLPAAIVNNPTYDKID